MSTKRSIPENSSEAEKILIVDDEPDVIESISVTLLSRGMPDTIACSDSRRIDEIVQKGNVGVMLLDLMMPGVRGEDVLVEFTRKWPFIPVIVVTAINDVSKTVECVKLGAFDYLVKPLDGDRLQTTINRALEFRQLNLENRRLSESFTNRELDCPEVFQNILTRSESMLRLMRYAEAIARSPKSILVTGETGVGKELMVKALHRLSGRKGKLVALNVAGADDEVFSDTLFGHGAGAFTGAVKDRNGLIETAADGTLLLDEIGDLSMASQVKLLRLLQEHEYFKLGEDNPKRSNARIICATHQEIEGLVQKGRFREDLFYRLRAHRLHIPPLRERLDHDLELLVEHFTEKAAEEMNKTKPAVPVEVLGLLSGYDFPGNVRELELIIYDVVGCCRDDRLSVEAVREHFAKTGTQFSLDSGKQPDNPSASSLRTSVFPTLKEMTARHVNDALARTEGNQTAAARMLGISKQALSQRLKRKINEEQES